MASKTVKKVAASSSPALADPPREKPIMISDLYRQMFDAYGPTGNEKSQNSIGQTITKYIQQVMEPFNCCKDFNIIFLFDGSIMVKSDADAVYSAVTAFKEKKPLFLILYSNGGDIGSAYLIGQLCREYSNGRFLIAVPRAAKSAATLLCCAADEIHMGSLSELGPIDPQINRLPALGLKSSIQHIAQLVKESPESADMFAKYLSYTLKPIDLGYYERVAESAVQYAEKLLGSHASLLPREASKIAHELVYAYKDHGFVIDKAEARKILGDKIVKHNTEEYSLANSLYKELSMIDSLADYLGYTFYFIGSADSKPVFRKRQE
jgi:hypothetical protein